MSLGRKILLTVAALVVVLVVAAATGFVLTFDANRYRSIILAELSRAVNRPVEAAELELRLLPLRLRLNQVRIPEAPGFAGDEFLRAQAAQFDFSVWSLLRGHPDVLALELDQPVVYLRQGAAGDWNLATLAAPAAPEGTVPGGPTPPSAAAAPVRNWLMREGTIVIERAGQPPLRLTGVELAVTDLATTEPFPFRLQVNFAPESKVSAAGQLGPVNWTVPRLTPLAAEVTLENFRPAALAPLVALPAQLTRLGPLAGTVKVDSGSEGLALTGAVNLLSSKPGENVAVQLAARLPVDFSRVELSNTSVQYGAAQVTGSGSVVLTPAVAFDLALRTADAELDALLRIPPRLGVALPLTPPPLAGKLTADVKISGTPENWQLTGLAKFQEAAFKLEGWAQPLRAASLEVRLEPERIVIAPFALSPQPDLSLTLSGVVANYRTRPTLEAHIGGAEVPLEPLLALAARFGKNPLAPGQKLSGRVSPAIRVSGPLAEPAKLSYQGTLTLRDISFLVAPLPEPLRIPAAELALDPTRLITQPFTAQLGEKLRARVTLRVDNYPTKPVLKGRVETEDADLAALLGLARAAGTDPLPGGRASGRVTATVEFSGGLGEKAAPLTLSGQLQLAAASVEPAALAGPLGIEQANLEFTPDRLGATNLRLAVAGAKVQGSIQVENFDAPRASFDLRGDTLDVEKLQALFGTQPVAPAAGRAAHQRLSEWFQPVVYAQGKPSDPSAERASWFARLSGRGRLAFDRVRHGTLTLAPFAAPAVVANLVVTCDPIEFGLYDGGGRGRLVVDLRGAEPVTEFNGLLRNVDANKLLSENSDSKNRLDGRLGGTVAVRFLGSERPRIMQSAQGQGEMTLVNGRLAQVNLNRELVLLGQPVGLSFEQRDTPIEDMTTRYEIADGWVRTRDLTLRTPEQTTEAVGGFSLEGELAFEATATFTPEASQRLTSRSPLGALTSNFFTDDQGRVVIPFLIRGTFAAPKPVLDFERLAEMKLRRGRSKPGGALGEILDRIRKRKEPPK